MHTQVHRRFSLYKLHPCFIVARVPQRPIMIGLVDCWEPMEPRPSGTPGDPCEFVESGSEKQDR